MKGEKLLQQAMQVFEERRANYGVPKQHLYEVAKRWSLVLGINVQPHHVAMCLMELKLARLKQNPAHADSLIDIAGYAAVMAEVVPTEGGLHEAD